MGISQKMNLSLMQLIWKQRLIILNPAKTNIRKKENEKMNENQAQNQAANQATNQASQKNQAAAKYAEAKTVVNGQEVSVQQAQAAAEAFDKQNNQTGIQAHHDNSSEAVQAGQTAQNAATMNESKLNLKQTNMQSGQSHLSGAGAQVQSEASQQAMAQQAAAKAKAKKAD